MFNVLLVRQLQSATWHMDCWSACEHNEEVEHLYPPVRCLDFLGSFFRAPLRYFSGLLMNVAQKHAQTILPW